MRPKVKFYAVDKKFWSEENRKNSTTFAPDFRNSQSSNFPRLFSDLNFNSHGKSPDFSVAQAKLPLPHLNCTNSSPPLQFTETPKTLSNSSPIKTPFCSDFLTSPFSLSSAPNVSPLSLFYSARALLPSALACFAAWASRPNPFASKPPPHAQQFFPSLPLAVSMPPKVHPSFPLSSYAARASRILVSPSQPSFNAARPPLQPLRVLASLIAQPSFTPVPPFQPPHATTQPPQSIVPPFPLPIATAQSSCALAQLSRATRSPTQPSCDTVRPPRATRLPFQPPQLPRPSRPAVYPPQLSRLALTAAVWSVHRWLSKP